MREGGEGKGGRSDRGGRGRSQGEHGVSWMSSCRRVMDTSSTLLYFHVRPQPTVPYSSAPPLSH